MRGFGSALGGPRRAAPVVRPSLTPYTSRPLPAAPTDPHVLAPPAGPASGPPPLPPGPAAGEVPGRDVFLDELGAIDPALAKSLIDAGVAVSTTVATEAPKWAESAREAKRHRRRGGGGGGGHRDDAPPPAPPPPASSGIGWVHVGIGALLLAAVGGAIYAFTRPRPVRYIRQEEAA